MNLVVRSRSLNIQISKPTHKSEEISLDTFRLMQLPVNGDKKAIKEAVTEAKLLEVARPALYGMIKKYEVDLEGSRIEYIFKYVNFFYT
jgi:hypothetical protein